MERLSGLDASFLYLESSAQLMHVCGLLLLDPSTVPGGYTFERLREDLEGRVTAIPAFRRKLHQVPLGLDHPVWVDDPDFDIDRHVHRVAVPAPGGPAELADLCGHLAGIPLDRARPLWEMCVVEGLASGQIAVFTKMHHATVDGKAALSLIDQKWYSDTFIPVVQQRGAAIIKARGLSSAASAANAACNTVYKLTHPTPATDWFSVGVHSDGSYGIEKGLIFSYPVRSNGKDFEIVQGLMHNDFSKAKIAATENELKEEKSLVADLIKK